MQTYISIPTDIQLKVTRTADRKLSFVHLKREHVFTQFKFSK